MANENHSFIFTRIVVVRPPKPLLRLERNATKSSRMSRRRLHLYFIGNEYFERDMLPEASTLTDDGLRELCRQALVNQPTDAQMAIPACRLAIRNKCLARLAKFEKNRTTIDFKARAAGN